MYINFDLDGTLVDFYNVPHWLDMLHAEDTTPYRVARPLVSMARLARYLNRLQAAGHKLRVISWGAKNSSDDFLAATAFEKCRYLDCHLPSVHWDEIYVIPYGTPKHSIGDGILFDDNAEIRLAWGGNAYNENEIFNVLKSLL